MKLGIWLRAEPSANSDAANAGRLIVERSAMLLPENLLIQPHHKGMSPLVPHSRQPAVL